MADDDRAEAEDGPRPSPFFVRALTLVSAIMMFCMMAVTFVDVVGRYGFNAPIGATFEIIELMMGILIISAQPIIARNRGHINVSLLDRFFQGRLRWFQQLFILAFSTCAAAFITSRMWAEMQTMRVDQDVGEYLDMELWPFIGIICALSVITFVVLVGLLISHLKGELADANADHEAPGDIL